MQRRRTLVLLLALVALAAGCSAPAAPAAPAAHAAAGANDISPAGPAIAVPAALKPAAVAPAAVVPPDWPVYHRDAGRSGNDPNFPALRLPLVHSWGLTLDGAVYAEPLVVGGHVIAATEGDSVYALVPTTGAVVWRAHLGTPVPLSTLPCGNINPLGITGTPAFDPVTGSIFAVAEVTGPHHVLFALDATTGAVRWSRTVDLAGDDPRTHQQRAALALGNGRVYIGFGGLAGDCGQYVGEVVGVPTTGVGATVAFRVPARREGAVWATGGPVLDASGNLYVSVGNGSSTTTYDGSDSVTKLSPTLALLSRFAPTTWAADNARDLDLGSMSPVLVPGLPGPFVFIVGKSGTAYVLRQSALGRIGGQVTSAAGLGAAFGASARNGSMIYVPVQRGIRQVFVRATGLLHFGWSTTTGAGGPPVIGGGAIWALNIATGRLFELSPATGAAISSIAIGTLPHFATPTLWNGRIFVGTMGGIVAIRGS